MKKIEFFKVEGDRINRFRRHCPKCGAGVFLAEHKNRMSCGKCGYTEFKSSVKKEPTPKTEKKPIEQAIQGEVKSEEPVIEEPKEESTVEPDVASEPEPPVEDAPSEKAPAKEPSKEEGTEETKESEEKKE